MPHVPAVRPVRVVELRVGLQIQIALHPGHGKNKSDLRTDADDARLEGAQYRSATAVGGELIVKVADHADLKLLGQELRGAPIELPIDAAGVIRRWVFKVSAQSGNSRKFVAGIGVEVVGPNPDTARSR
jgi:hypothetical protein